MRNLAMSTLLILLLGVGVAHAIDVGGEAHFNYVYYLPTFDGDYDPRAASNDFSSFEFPLARLVVTGEPYPLWTARLATDVERVRSFEADVDGDGDTEKVDTPDEGRFEVVLRYAHIVWQPRLWFGVDAGMTETPWIGFVERAETRRFIDRLLVDRAGWLGELTDLGVAAVGEFPAGYGGYRLQVSNGSGASNFTVGKHKAIEARVTLIPAFTDCALRNLSLSLGGRYFTEDDPPGDQLDRDAVLAAMLHWHYRMFDIGAEGSFDHHWSQPQTRPTSNGLAATGWLAVRPISLVEPFVRVERFDPDLDASGYGRADSRIDGERLPADEDGYTRLLAGVTFYPAPKIRFAVAGRVRWFDETYDAGPERGEPIAPEVDARAALAFEL